ncbi:MAG: CoA transferase [Actinomycetota bacterium]
MTTTDGVAAGLPPGVPALARALLAEDALRQPDEPPLVDDARLADELSAPHRLERDWPAPTPPVAVTGGWVHADLVDDDRPLFDALVAADRSAGPEAVAARCQEARLPVTPYRRPGPDAVPAPDLLPTPAKTSSTTTGPTGVTEPGAHPLAGTLVVDMTSHWAGPLAAALLAERGATVVKIEPAARPDGFRDRPALYAHLNHRKDHEPLDLRRPTDRERFETLLERAALVVSSFSRRVLPNLGYGPERLRSRFGVSTVAISAFPATGRTPDWVAYGPGVHAAAGLGLAPTRPEARPVPAPVAYPDVLAGLAAYVVAGRLLRVTAGPPRSAEVSLAGTIRPLTTAESSGGAA